MGSNPTTYEPKLASSPDLVLTTPTPAERVRIWTQTHGMWGKALSLETYLDREEYLITVPMANNGGMTHWILTDSTLPPDERPLLSSCESIRKPAVTGHKTESGEVVVVDGIAHGIASVFTDPQYRGRGYAGRMMADLGPRLRYWQAGEDADGKPKESLFSILYSDIGKTFYARKGWAPFPSTHLSFVPDEAAEARTQPPKDADPLTVEPIANYQLAELSAIDETLLRERIATKPPPSGASVAILPSLNALLWHTMREDYMMTFIFKRTPSVRGALANGQQKGHRMWAVWTRAYHGGLATSEGNTLHILRVVLEDHSDDATEGLTDRHVDGFRAIIGMAQAEAARWNCSDVHLWNPTPAILALTERAGLPITLVDREKDSIASLMSYGAGPTDAVHWVANEKYGWC